MTVSPSPIADAAGARLLIIESPYYAEIAAGLRRGALHEIAAAGASHEVVRVGGSFELPGAIRIAIRASAAGRAAFDGYVALGCVIRGETDHYDHIARETARGLMDLSIQFGVPVAFGVLTVHHYDQAAARAQVPPAGGWEHNKGREAARAALGQVALARRFG
ncbi:MAG: 6,7-dimethyl-8-ribityllumazine synthase [Acetobacteraceae bacterium]|nr:6,7-dimethyl-8-ribityllumazine synthase [Acetobacteraceae bacterium]